MIELCNTKYFTRDEVMEMFNVNKDYFARQISDGKIPRSKIGKNYYFSETDLKAWLDNNRVEAEPKKKTDSTQELDREYILSVIEANSIEVINEFLTSSDDETILQDANWIVDCTVDSKKEEIKAYLKGIATA